MTEPERQVPAFDLKRQVLALKGELLPALEQVVLGCSYALGPQVEEFERGFAQLCGAREAVGVNSGTSALHLALLACGVGPGDEVITTPWTFIATCWAISYTGATPVFVDVREDTLCIDPEQVAAKVSQQTKAVIPVHIYGQVADMDPLREICQARGLSLIEDAAQAHGARYKGRPAGSLGDAACFSFYPSKNLGACGEAGAVVTSNAELAHKIRLLRNHSEETRYQHAALGFNYRMEGIQGAVLNVKLPHLARWNARRREIAARYHEELADLAELRLPTVAAEREHVFHQFVVRHPRREELREELQRRGVGTALHYPRPVHLQPAYAHLGYREGSFPVAERAAGEVFSLPCFPEMSEAELEHVIASLRAALG